MLIGWEIKNNWRLKNALNVIKNDNKSLMKCEKRDERKIRANERKGKQLTIRV